MNKGFTLAVLGVVLCAMGLVYFLHSGGETPVQVSVSSTPHEGGAGQPAPPAGEGAGAPGTPARAPESLPRVDPPPAVTPGGGSGPMADTQGGAPSRLEPPRATPPGETPAPVEQPKAEQPKAETPKAEAPKGEAPKTEQPRAEAPKTEQPKAETPKVEIPKAEAPKTDPGKADTPVREENLSATASHTLRGISLHFADQKMLLRIEADGAFPIKAFFLPNPPRLVLDLPGKWSGMKAPTVPQNRVIKNVRLGSQPGGPRLVLDLNDPLKNRDIRRPSSSTVEVLVE